MIAFWTWLRDFANERVRACYMERFHYAQKCPVCHTWSSETGGAKDYIADPHNPESYMQCRRCHQWSRWSHYGPLGVCEGVAQTIPCWDKPS